MKVAKSKSCLNVSKPSRANPEVSILKTELQDLYEKESELDQIKIKVQRSVPILETIYDKVKKREERLERTISTLTKRVSLTRKLVVQYKDLYEEGLKIIQRNRVIDQYGGLSNYREKEGKQNEKKKKQGNTLISDLKEKYKIKQSLDRLTADKIKQSYQSKKQRIITTEQIYNKLKAKLAGDKTLFVSSNNQRRQTHKQYAQGLIKQIDQDIQQLTKQKQPRVYTSLKRPSQQELKMRQLKIQRQKLQAV